jgi:hypothetical protein
MVYTPCPTRTIEFTIALNPPGSTAPLFGYYARWRVFDNSNNPGTWSDYVRTDSTTIQLTGVPRCNTVQIEVKASCSPTQFGASQFFTVAPNIATSTVITAVGTCDNSGGGVYTFTGTPGQYATVGVELSGNIQFNNTNTQSGACAWIETSISSLEATSNSATAKSSSITGTQSIIMVASACQITVQFPASGVVTVNTSVKMYNVVSTNTSTALVKVLTMGNIATNISTTICKAQLSSVNCG